MTVAENLFESLRLELRRGSLTLAVLAKLRQEHYGYTLRKDLAERGLEIDESTLYPLLRRLETQGLLVSQWREEDKRNKRFYRLSPDGEQILAKLLDEWQAINASINRIFEHPQSEQLNSEQVRKQPWNFSTVISKPSESTFPVRRQDDIIAELRANMESQIEDKESELGRPLTQGEMEDLLRKMGAPVIVASRYQPQQYLIGPAIFPMYLYVLRLVMLWAFVYLHDRGGRRHPAYFPRCQGHLRVPVAHAWRPHPTAAWVTLVFAALDFFRARYPKTCPPLPAPPTIGTLVRCRHLKSANRPAASVVPSPRLLLKSSSNSLLLVWLLLIPSHPFLMLGPGVVFLKVVPYQLSPAWWTFYWWIIALNIVQWSGRSYRPCSR